MAAWKWRECRCSASQRGFTLIELMVVVAIIGTLAAIAIPAYQNYTKRAYVAEGLNLATAAKSSVEEFYSATGQYPANNTSAGLSNAIVGTAVSAVEIAASGRVVVTFNTKVSDGATVVLVPAVVSGSIRWTCASGTVSIQYIPFNCRG